MKRYITKILIFLTFTLSTGESISQCDFNTPTFIVDLTGSPNGDWISPWVFRDEDCCGGGSNNSNCVEFIVTLDSAAQGILLDIYDGAAPNGSLFYSVNCGPPISIGTPLCLDGVGPHSVTFCKPGNNQNQYIISSIMDPFVTTSLAINNGCSSFINTGNYVESTIVWNSVFPGSPGDWNYYLDCVTGCDTITVTALDTLYPTFIDYEVCGTPLGGCDTNICDTVRIEFSTTLFVDIVPVSTLLCPMDSGTSISLSVAGGFPPYTFQWSTGEATSTIFTGAGTHTVIVVDQSDCPPTSASVVIDQITDTITANAGVNQIACSDVVQVQLGGSYTGGTGAFWSGGSGVYAQSANDTNAIYYPTTGEITGGSVDLIITNTGVGICPADSDTMTINFVGFDGINTILVTNSSCSGSSNGSATINTAGLTPPYSYTWNTLPIQTGVAASNIPPGTYTVDAIDGNGCMTTETFTVTEPVPLTASFSQENISCFFGNDGSATVTPFGGTAPYSYSWTLGGGTDSTATNLSIGVYTATITDVNNCQITVDIIITEPPVIAATISSFTDVSCFGGSDGTATVVATGGTPGYTYSWDQGAGNAQTAIGLSANMYTITVSDSNGCQGIANVQINEPAAGLSTIITNSDVSCNGGNDGEAIVTPSGGSIPYGYVWSNTDTDSIANGLVAGNYIITVTDNNGCISINNITINEPTQLITTMTSLNDVSCNGGNDGEASLGTGGGTGTYSYSWSPNVGSGPLVSNLVADTYIVTTTDNLNCTDSDTIIINEPSAPLTNTTTQVNNPCNGDNLGEAIVTPAGGTAPYEYFWSSIPSINDSVNGLSAGVYNILVTDTNGCTSTNSVTIVDPAAMVISAFGVDATCGLATGEVHATVSGGTPGYTFLWNPGANPTLDVIGIVAGAYTFSVVDALGCTDSTIVIVSNITGPTASIDAITNASCFGGNDGSITVSTSGGVAPLTYLWSPSGGTGLTENNLSTGAYIFGITDANGCQDFIVGTITEPDSMITAMISSGVICNGDNTGVAEVFVSGGTLNYNYSWDNTTDVTSVVNGLLAGMQTVTVIDANGCSIVDSILVTQPSPLGLSISGTNISCFQGTDGTATGTVSGGVPGYTYNWSSTGGSLNQATGLQAGVYTLTATDANNCTVLNTITLTEPLTSVTSTMTSINVSCFGGNNGEAIVTPSGGTSPYSYFWTNADTDSIIGNLSADTLSVLITDVNGCIANNQIVITEPPALTTGIVNIVNTFCELTNGGATVTATGGTSLYSYLWSTGNTTPTISNQLFQGIYTVVTTDANGCNNTDTVTIGNVPSPEVTIVSQANVSCNGGNNGQILAAGTLGVTPYSFSWAPSGSTQNPATGLSAGQHVITLTDANGCATSDSIIITEPFALTASVSSVINVSCFGGSDGSAQITVIGGTLPYSYLWSNGDSTATGNNLAVGAYSVTITDGQSCTIQQNILISQPSEVDASINTFTDETCIDSFDGTATVVVTGGTPGYSYVWNSSPFQTNITAADLPPGSYQVVVEDGNGCVDTSFVVIGSPSPVLTQVIPNDTICFGDNTVLTATGAGGAGNYLYFWDNNIGLADSTTVSPGAETTYNVTAIDQLGCLGTTMDVTVFVESLSQQDLDVFANSPICPGTSTLLYATLNGANTGPVTYSWTPILGDSAGAFVLFPTQPTTYVVSVTNDCGVTVSDSVSVDFKPLPTILFSPLTLTGCEPTTIPFFDQSISNTPGDSINLWIWSFGDGDSSFVQNPTHVYDSAGVYDVTLSVTTSAGCVGDSTLGGTIIVHPNPIADFENEIGNISSFDMEASFTNLSEGAVSYIWSFGDGTGSNTENPSHLYQIEGIYDVFLIAISEQGCIDTTLIPFTIKKEFTLYVPNTFTPDGDGVNETFFATGNGIDDNRFELWIFNRWGEVIFFTNDYYDQWDGNNKNGTTAQDGTYVWMIKTVGAGEKHIELQGHVNLLR